MNGTRSTRNLSRFESLFGPEGEAGRRIQLAILMLSGIIVVGTTGYMLGWDFLDALYMTVITVGTIGELKIGEKTGAILLAIRNGEGTFEHPRRARVSRTRRPPRKAHARRKAPGRSPAHQQ